MPQFIRRFFVSLALVVGAIQPAQAALNAATLQTQLDQINTQGRALLSQIRGVRGTQLFAPLSLIGLQSASDRYAASVEALSSDIALETGTLPVTPGVLASLSALSNNQAALSRETSRMGSSAALANFTSPNGNLLATYATILRLSDDIGVMADRIGEMADRILIMADKIGEMADRILVTQQIQSANLALTFDMILKTQENMLLMMQILKPCR